MVPLFCISVRHLIAIVIDQYASASQTSPLVPSYAYVMVLVPSYAYVMVLVPSYAYVMVLVPSYAYVWVTYSINICGMREERAEQGNTFQKRVHFRLFA
jgi:hypothetical protein